MALLDFSPEEKRALEETVRRVLASHTAPSSASRGEDAWDVGEDHQAPETYVAQTPSGGIDALVDVGTGTGTPEPGSAVCEIYAVEENRTTGLPELLKVADLDLLVYNISDTAIDGDTWITVTRSKQGRWIALAGGGATVQIRVGVITGICDDDPDTGTGTGTISTDSGLYEVTLTQNTSLAEPTCSNVVTAFAEQLCCDIIDDETGDFTTCKGVEGTTGTDGVTGTADITGECIDTIAASGIGVADDDVITVRDLSGRQIPVGATVVVGKIGDIWVILEAGFAYNKVCLLSDIDCQLDCDNEVVFLRTFTPIWLPEWQVCPSQAEFIPPCP